MNFPDSYEVPITNHLTGHTYRLVNAGGLEPTDSTLRGITAICNEPAIYDWLFRPSLEGKPYPEQKAREFLAWSKAGWDTRTHFVFAVIDGQGEIAAACDLKSIAPVPEMGYWASHHHRGIMTNAVRAVIAFASAAGFTALYARTKIGNTQSQSVLLRAGFHAVPSPAPDYLRFEHTLAGGQAHADSSPPSTD